MWRWPIFIVCLLVGTAISNAVLFFRAQGDRSFSVEPNYYQKAVQWDRTQNQRSVNNTLGWVMKIDLKHHNPQSTLSIMAIDNSGQAITNATIEVVLFHRARAANRISAKLTHQGSGRYSVPVPMHRPGLWQVQLTAQAANKKFTDEQTIEVTE